MDIDQALVERIVEAVRLSPDGVDPVTLYKDPAVAAPSFARLMMTLHWMVNEHKIAVSVTDKYVPRDTKW